MVAHSFFIAMEIERAYEIFLDNNDFKRAYLCLKDLDKSRVREFRAALTDGIIRGKSDDLELLRKSYELTAKENFEDFCIFHEWKRDEKFYTPRRKGLKPVVNALQRLSDDETDLLCVSLPPGTGKTGLAIYFMAWLCGNDPYNAILGSSHNASFLRGVYDEILKEINTDEYGWSELFKHRVLRTNAQDMKIDVAELRRFSSLQFTSVGAENSGKVRAQKLLYCDDLITGIEEALSADRLEKKWQLYTTDLKQRKQGKCRELHISTRWSVNDIIGRLQRDNENNPRAEFISVPALNEQGESNFDYGGTIGFTKEFYEDMKSTMEPFAFNALYMNEPIEREGLLYQRDSLRRFYDLPTDAEGKTLQPDAIIGVCDTAEGKGDDTVLPIGYVYGNDHYIFDAVCTDALPEVTDGLCARVLAKHKVKACQFESNSAGGRTADKVSELCQGLGWKCNITKKRTTQNKETKIIVNSAWVKEHCLFLDDSKIEKNSYYEAFLKKLCSWTMKGRNKHDDVPDAMAQYALFVETFTTAAVTVGTRFF